MYDFKILSVDRVVDGDTVDLVLDLGFHIHKHERVRLAGVDTPEKRTRNLREKQLGNDASDFVESWLAENTDLVVHTEKDGKYGRMLGWIYCGDVCLNHLLIDEGYAWQYVGGSRVDADDMASLMLLLNKRGYDTWEDYAER